MYLPLDFPTVFAIPFFPVDACVVKHKTISARTRLQKTSEDAVHLFPHEVLESLPADHCVFHL